MFVTGKYLTLLYLSYALLQKEMLKATVCIIVSVCQPARNNLFSTGRIFLNITLASFTNIYRSNYIRAKVEQKLSLFT